LHLILPGVKNFLKSTIFLAIIAALLWSTAFAGVKIGLKYHTPLQFGSFRFILAGLMVMIAYGNMRKYMEEVKSEWRFILLIATIQTVIQYGMFYTGMSLVPGSLGAMIVGSSPLFIAFLAHFTHPDDKMTFLKTSSFLIGVLGIVIITLGRQGVELKNKWESWGIVLLILNNFASGYSNVLVSKNPRPISPIVLTSSSLLIGGLTLYLISLPLEGFQTGPFPVTWYIALFWLAFISSAAFSIWYTLLKRPGVKVSELNIWKFLIPVSGAGLSWMLVAGEKPDWTSISGMVVIAGALFLMYFSTRGKKNVEVIP
jgi:drug/metabolite transporter (DMT)-like permease